MFGVLECLMSAGIAAGAMLAPLLVHLGGTTAAIVGTGLLLPGLALLIGRRLFALDASATVPIVEIGLLRSLRLFSALSPPALEGIARNLVPLQAPAGTAIVTQGEEGDHYYAIAEGELEVVVDGTRVTVLARGEGFGEIALLHDCTRNGDRCGADRRQALHTGEGAVPRGADRASSSDGQRDGNRCRAKLERLEQLRAFARAHACSS